MLPSRSRWSKRFTFNTSPSISKSNSKSRSISSSQCSTAAVNDGKQATCGVGESPVVGQFVEKLDMRFGD